MYACDPDDGNYWIMAFVLDKNFQRRGLGRSAMTELTAYMREKHGCSSIRLGHRLNNERAAQLYQSLGFIEIGREGLEVIRCLEYESDVE